MKPQELEDNRGLPKERSVSRRDFIKSGSFVATGAMLGVSGLLSACSDAQSGEDESGSEAATTPTIDSENTFDEAEMREFAKYFFDVAGANDRENFLACFAPDAIVWNNTTEDVIYTSEEIAVVLMDVLGGAVTDKQYEERRVNVFPEGFVERHLLCGTRKTDGVRVRMPAILVIERNDDGLITRIDNYEDSAKAAEFYI